MNGAIQHFEHSVEPGRYNDSHWNSQIIFSRKFTERIYERVSHVIVFVNAYLILPATLMVYTEHIYRFIVRKELIVRLLSTGKKRLYYNFSTFYSKL